MIIAALSDIHGNQYALEQVLIEAKRNDVSKLLVLGDIVGYYYDPHIALEMINQWDFELIRGNHETMLHQFIRGKIEMTFLKKKYGSGHQVALDKLSGVQLNRLLDAPEQKEVEYDGTKILMCHGSNWDPNFYLYPDTDKEILNRTNEPNVHFVLVGHSHYPFIHRNQDNILINVGSVGQSRAKGGIANWALLNTESNSFQLMSTPYKIDLLIEEIEKKDPNHTYMIEVLRRNNEK